MSYYLHNVELPFCNKTIYYRELTTSEQLALAKANFAMPTESGDYKSYAFFIKKIISDCVENKSVLDELNLIEYILFITKLRSLSFGSILELQYKDPNNAFKNVKITVDLQNFIKNLYKASIDLQKYINIGDIEIELSWPHHSSENYFFEADSHKINSVIDSLPQFIKKIKIKDDIIDLWKFDNTEKENVFDNLPVSIRTPIQNEILKAIKFQSSYDLFGIPQMEDYKFSFFNKTYQDLLRLFFSFDISEIYQEYYILIRKQFSPNYINNITSTERKLYLSLVEKEREQSSSNEGGGSTYGGTSLEQLASEFGDEMPN
jgi:hypothetical protein